MILPSFHPFSTPFHSTSSFHLIIPSPPPFHSTSIPPPSHLPHPQQQTYKNHPCYCVTVLLCYCVTAFKNLTSVRFRPHVYTFWATRIYDLDNTYIHYYLKMRDGLCAIDWGFCIRRFPFAGFRELACRSERPGWPCWWCRAPRRERLDSGSLSESNPRS